MGTLTARLIDVIRTWSTENGREDYELIYWIQLYLGWPYPSVGVNPDLARMSPVQRARRPVIEHSGHPEIDQLRERLNELAEQGVWEPFLVCSIARCIADELDRLADSAGIARERDRFRRELEDFSTDPQQRREWVKRVKQSQVSQGIPLDDHATDASVDEFIARATSQLQPLTAAEIAERNGLAESWRRLAGDLLDFPVISRQALLADE